MLVLDSNAQIGGNQTLQFCQYGNNQTPVNGCIATMNTVPAANGGSVGQTMQSWDPGPFPKFNYGVEFICSSAASANITLANLCGFQFWRINMGKFSGSRSDSLFGQLRHKNIRTRSQNYWGHKNKVTGNRPKTVDQKHKAGEALFMQRIAMQEENKCSGSVATLVAICRASIRRRCNFLSSSGEQ